VSAVLAFWVLIVVLAIGTWLMRSLPIMAHGHVATPPWAERLLRHVPVVALTALVVPGALYLKDHAGAYHFAPERLLAAAAAMLVALKTRNVAATLVVGMVARWVAQAAVHALA